MLPSILLIILPRTVITTFDSLMSLTLTIVPSAVGITNIVDKVEMSEKLHRFARRAQRINSPFCIFGGSFVIRNMSCLREKLRQTL